MRFDEMFNEMQKDKVDASFISSPKYDGVYNWHKTTDQLPPVGCYVLGYWGARQEPRIVICKNDEKQDGYRWQGLDHSRYHDDEITHWTHFPNAPEVV